MVLELIFPIVFGFVFVSIAAYIGALRALDVYFDPDTDSYFLSDNSSPPKRPSTTRKNPRSSENQ